MTMMGDAATRLFFELYSGLPRQGPGTADCTRQALSLLPPLSPGTRILDIGCGTGAQTIELARSSPARIVAMDFHSPFLEELEAKAAELGFGDRIQAVLGDMAKIELPDASFDVLWSEGAIYFLGFDRGLAEWRRLLKPAGYMAVSEVSWIASGAPRECAEYWAAQYPAIRGVAGNIQAVERAGYRLVAHFALPAAAWWEDYYIPLERNLAAFRRRHGADEAAARVAEESDLEIEMFRRYSDFYGYVFYVIQSV